jgi:Bacteriophage minor capsid protein
MSSPGVEIKSFLDGLGTLGAIRVGILDATPDELCAINEYGGLTPIGKFGVQGVGQERPSLQIIFRGTPNDYATPMSRARIAYFALAAVQPGTLSGTIYDQIIPIQPPFSLGKDTNNRYEISCNYYLIKDPS